MTDKEIEKEIKRREKMYLNSAGKVINDYKKDKITYNNAKRKLKALRRNMNKVYQKYKIAINERKALRKFDTLDKELQKLKKQKTKTETKKKVLKSVKKTTKTAKKIKKKGSGLLALILGKKRKR